MDRLKQRIDIAKQALITLKEVMTITQPSAIERDAALQRFEYTVEAAWKAARQYLRDVEGMDVGSPKGVIRSCREVGLLNLEEANLALEMIDDRNLTVHTYNVILADAIYQRVKGYTPLLGKWIDKLSNE